MSVGSFQQARKFLLLLLAIFPYIVGFAPADTDGTFISLSGGKGVYPTATCSDTYRNNYSEAAVAVDHRFSTRDDQSFITPDYVTLGVYGQTGTNDRILVYSNGESNSSDIPPESRTDLGAFGGHVGTGLEISRACDIGGIYGALSEDDNKLLLPSASLRIGSAYVYVSSSILQSRPFFSGGGYANAGLGTQVGALQIWGGVGAGPGESVLGILRLRYHFYPVAFNFNLQGPSPFEAQAYPYKEENGMALGVEFRLP